jgi:hypothetical protein
VTTLRIQKVSLTAAPLVHLRVYKTSLTAAVPATTKLRVFKTSITAVGAVIVTVEPELTAGPGELLEIVADLVTPGAATWAWRRISGPVVGLVPDGDTVRLTVPSLWNSDRAQPTAGVPGVSTLILGVSATIDGVQSPEVRCEVAILPQVSWARASGGTWAGARVAPAP